MKLKKTWKRVLAALMTGALVVGMTPETGMAAAPVKLAKKSVTLSVTSTTHGIATIKVKIATGIKVVKTTYKSANKKIATVTKKGKVTAQKAGQTKVTVTLSEK